MHPYLGFVYTPRDVFQAEKRPFYPLFISFGAGQTHGGRLRETRRQGQRLRGRRDLLWSCCLRSPPRLKKKKKTTNKKGKMRLIQSKSNSIFWGEGETQRTQPCLPTAVRQRGSPQGLHGAQGHPQTHPPGGLGPAARPKRFRRVR